MMALGAFKAQKNLGIGSIGGKDSMSGSFEKLDVPPTLISFAVTMGKTSEVISPEFKKAGNKVVLLKPEYDENGLPVTESLIALYNKVTSLARSGKAVSIYTPTIGGVAEAVYKMAIGNGLGFEFADGISLDDIFGYSYGSFVVELAKDADAGVVLGTTTEKKAISYNGEALCMCEISKAYESKLEKIYSCSILL